MQEREVARKLSHEVDRLLAGAETDATDDTPYASAVAKELAVARRIGQWSERLPPVPAGLQRRVQRRVEAPMGARRSRTWRSAAWGALAATLVFLVVWMVAPSGQQVWAQVIRALKIGQTYVELTPTLDAPVRVVRDPLRDLVAAELLMGRAPSLPKVLPEGYELIEIVAVSYPDLPAWISQPFYIELSYGPEGGPPGLRLRQYRLLFREYGGISAFQPASESVSAFEMVDVSGVPGALLAFSRGDATLAVVWERDGLLLELETDRLEKAELLEIAQTVR
jgi:hypothetical protein